MKRKGDEIALLENRNLKKFHEDVSILCSNQNLCRRLKVIRDWEQA